MPRSDGYKNIKPIKSDKASVMGSKGGVRSGEVRRERASMRKALEYLLSLPYAKNPNMNNLEAVCVAVMNKALRGDIRAMEFVFRILGELPSGGRKRHTIERGNVVVTWGSPVDALPEAI